MWVETRTTKDGQTRYRFLERYTCPYSGKIKRVSVTYATNFFVPRLDPLWDVLDILAVPFINFSEEIYGGPALFIL